MNNGIKVATMFLGGSLLLSACSPARSPENGTFIPTPVALTETIDLQSIVLTEYYLGMISEFTQGMNGSSISPEAIGEGSRVVIDGISYRISYGTDQEYLRDFVRRIDPIDLPRLGAVSFSKVFRYPFDLPSRTITIYPNNRRGICEDNSQTTVVDSSTVFIPVLTQVSNRNEGLTFNYNGTIHDNGSVGFVVARMVWDPIENDYVLRILGTVPSDVFTMSEEDRQSFINELYE